MSDTINTTDDTEPVMRTFLESLFRALRADIATLKQDLTKDFKGLTKDMNELGDCVDTLERTGETQGEELDTYRCEILELQDRNMELRYQRATGVLTAEASSDASLAQNCKLIGSEEVHTHARVCKIWKSASWCAGCEKSIDLGISLWDFQGNENQARLYGEASARL
ncbi:hypothetical protein NDU88_002285 [Pleurodeles waltl]|uniref:Uncharacterized protein n=1 Tax=Pleurodeles waltl TaxID=8319 RepID=A0AAV7M5K0_PLEWA|nr:hypothetical protein NDU88_002285 [Pleurodeles waltl]